MLDQHVIQEKEEEENEVSQVNIDLTGRKKELDEKTNFVNMYKRIDQPSLTEAGLRPKQLLCQEAITNVYSYSMLQRFRSNKDLKAFDKSRPLPIDQDDDDDYSGSDNDQVENTNKQNIPKPVEVAQKKKLNQIQD